MKNCVSCKNETSGMHSCTRCYSFVHAIETCSVADGEEGCGQKRVCLSCVEKGPASTAEEQQDCTQDSEKEANFSNNSVRSINDLRERNDNTQVSTAADYHVKSFFFPLNQKA